MQTESNTITYRPIEQDWFEKIEANNRMISDLLAVAQTGAEWLSVRQVAIMIGSDIKPDGTYVKEDWVRRTLTKLIPHYRPQHDILFRADDVRSFMESKRTDPVRSRIVKNHSALGHATKS